MKESKKFQFEGIDAKTEWKIGLILAIPALFVFFSVMYLFEFYLPRINFLYTVLSAAILTIVIGLLLLKFLAKTIKNKTWIINTDDRNLEIVYKEKKDIILLNDIRIIKNMGNVGFRYLTIVTPEKSIKIRVGNTDFVPFSSQFDIEKVDEFLEYLTPFLNENFNKKELKNKINTNVFPNYGVYVAKYAVIKYSILNRLKPWQIILIFICGGFLLLVILFTQLEKYW